MVYRLKAVSCFTCLSSGCIGVIGKVISRGNIYIDSFVMCVYMYIYICII